MARDQPRRRLPRKARWIAWLSAGVLAGLMAGFAAGLTKPRPREL